MGSPTASPEKTRDAVIAYLRERELVTDVYREVWRPIRLDRPGRPTVMALTYVVDRGHRQYAGRLAPEAILRHVRDSHGRSGANADYVINTVRHLRTPRFSRPRPRKGGRHSLQSDSSAAGVGREKG